MHDMGLRPESGYKKSARIVGEVLGKYHPHGDMAVYESMARMAQDFSMRVLLVDGQGNFGSIDGDPPAAMRYTEARLTAAAENMLVDIQKNTVNFDPNFDDTLREPQVLPAALPNLLVNGASGIAVGMSTSIPPHNLNEVIEALRYMLENWEKMDDINLEHLMRFIKGPDFPTGGIILQRSDEESLASAYGTGRGRVTIQARAHLEEMERGRNRIIVTELPYLTNKSSLIERIADLVREERLTGIADLRDESDRQGMRIVIELNKAADPQALLRDLYKHTPMQSTFSIIMLALVEGEPRLLSLKQALRVYLDHRLEVIRKRTEYDLEKARQRAHILEGLRVALQNLDEVISLIRQAPDADTARVRLIRRFKLSDVQAQAILDMQLRRLASLERKKIELEYKEVVALIKELESLLRSPKRIRTLAADELQAIGERYGDRRRTQVVQLSAGKTTIPLTASELAPNEDIWVVVSPDGLVSRTAEANPPRLSGSDAPAWILKANSRDTLYLVAEDGKAAAVTMQAVPETDKPSMGVPYARLSALQDNDHLTVVFSLPTRSERPEGWFVLTATRQGMVKKTGLEELPGPSASTFTLARVNQGDRLGWLRLTNGQKDICLLSASGMAIRFSEGDIRPMGLVAAGVLGIKLAGEDEVVGLELLPGEGDLLLVATDGSAKRVPVDQFPRQGRYGQGIVAWKLPPKVHAIGLALGKGPARLTLHLDKLAPKMIRMDGAPLQTRAARGKPIQDLKSGDSVLFLTIPWEMDHLSPKKEMNGKTPARRPAVKKVTNELQAAKDGNQPSEKPPTTTKLRVKSSAPITKTQRAKDVSGSPTGASKAKGKPASKPVARPTAVKKAATAKKTGESKPIGAVKTSRVSKSSTVLKTAPASRPTTGQTASTEAKKRPGSSVTKPGAKTAGGTVQVKLPLEDLMSAGRPIPAKTKSQSRASTAAKKVEPAMGAARPAGKTASKQSAIGKPAPKTPATKKPAPSVPAGKTPAKKTPATGKPATKKTSTKEPASGKPPVKKSTTKVTAAKQVSKNTTTSAASKPAAARQPAGSKTTTKPAAKKPPAGKSPATSKTSKTTSTGGTKKSK
jgi:DNA gyrase subunit A